MGVEHWYAVEAALWAMTFMFTALGFEMISLGYSVLKPSLLETAITQMSKLKVTTEGNAIKFQVEGNN